MCTPHDEASNLSEHGEVRQPAEDRGDQGDHRADDAVRGCSGSTIARVGSDDIQPSGEFIVGDTQGDACLPGWLEYSSIAASDLQVIQPQAAKEEAVASGVVEKKRKRRAQKKAVRSVVDSVSVPSSADTSCNGEQIWDEETQSAFGSTSMTSPVAVRCSEAVAEVATSKPTFERNPAKSFAAVTLETQVTGATDEQLVSEDARQTVGMTVCLKKAGFLNILMRRSRRHGMQRPMRVVERTAVSKVQATHCRGGLGALSRGGGRDSCRGGESCRIDKARLRREEIAGGSTAPSRQCVERHD